MQKHENDIREDVAGGFIPTKTRRAQFRNLPGQACTHSYCLVAGIPWGAKWGWVCLCDTCLSRPLGDGVAVETKLLRNWTTLMQRNDNISDTIDRRWAIFSSHLSCCQGVGNFERREHAVFPGCGLSGALHLLQRHRTVAGDKCLKADSSQLGRSRFLKQPELE